MRYRGGSPVGFRYTSFSLCKNQDGTSLKTPVGFRYASFSSLIEESHSSKVKSDMGIGNWEMWAVFYLVYFCSCFFYIFLFSFFFSLSSEFGPAKKKFQVSGSKFQVMTI
ncbi:MAG: hypothetical protein CFE24_12120 [Flavobacterium sp. BFFFF2]|nr:MAG: hypothetical protein CFE24_12120 [Flavobacterium sp. BFFFF2]